MTYPKLIVGPKLTPTMERIRSGPTQLFRDTKPGDRSFISHENADVILEPPEKHIYAELIDEKWYWVNGCDICNGKKKPFGSYVRCVKHDVCFRCGTPRSELKEIPWGVLEGIQCKPCADKQHQIEKIEALAKMERVEYDEWDYRDKNSVTCPYCNLKLEESHKYYESSSEKVECPRCDNVFEVTAEHSVTFTTRRL